MCSLWTHVRAPRTSARRTPARRTPARRAPARRIAVVLLAVLLASLSSGVAQAQCPSASAVRGVVLPPAPDQARGAASIHSADESGLAGGALAAPRAEQSRPAGSWWGTRLRFNHARGRLFLSTVVPVLVGSALVRVGDATTEDGDLFASPASIAGVGVYAAGLIAGPSMGLWCVGTPRLRRKAWWGAGLRTVGLGAVGFGVWRAVETTEDDGLAGIVTLPLTAALFAIPGITVTALGVAWSSRATPDRWCRGHGDRNGVTVSPHADPVTRGHGVQLRLRW